MREVAAVAGVDQSLVLHYFANKYELFVAAMTPAFPGPEVLRHALSGCREDFGTSLATGLLEAMKIDEVRQVLVGLLRAAATDERAASFAKDFVKNQFVGPLATCLDVDKDPEGASTRAGVLVAQIVGFLFARHILQVDALVESSDEETVRILGARLQQAVDGAQQSD